MVRILMPHSSTDVVYPPFRNLSTGRYSKQTRVVSKETGSRSEETSDNSSDDCLNDNLPAAALIDEKSNNMENVRQYVMRGDLMTESSGRVDSISQRRRTYPQTMAFVRSKQVTMVSRSLLVDGHKKEEDQEMYARDVSSLALNPIEEVLASLTSRVADAVHLNGLKLKGHVQEGAEDLEEEDLEEAAEKMYKNLMTESEKSGEISNIFTTRDPESEIEMEMIEAPKGDKGSINCEGHEAEDISQRHHMKLLGLISPRDLQKQPSHYLAAKWSPRKISRSHYIPLEVAFLPNFYKLLGSKKPNISPQIETQGNSSERPKSALEPAKAALLRSPPKFVRKRVKTKLSQKTNVDSMIPKSSPIGNPNWSRCLQTVGICSPLGSRIVANLKPLFKMNQVKQEKKVLEYNSYCCHDLNDDQIKKVLTMKPLPSPPIGYQRLTRSTNSNPMFTALSSGKRYSHLYSFGVSERRTRYKEIEARLQQKNGLKKWPPITRRRHSADVEGSSTLMRSDFSGCCKSTVKGWSET